MLVQQLARLGHAVGREGRTRQRVRPARRGGLGRGWRRRQDSGRRAAPLPEMSRGLWRPSRRGTSRQTVAFEVDGAPAPRATTCSRRASLNTMVRSSPPYASEVTRVAREVGSGGQAGRARRTGAGVVRGLEGPHRQRREQHGVQLSAARSATFGRYVTVANGTSPRRSPSTSAASCSNSRTRSTPRSDQLRSFASEVTRVAREVGTEGRLGGQAVVPGSPGRGRT